MGITEMKQYVKLCLKGESSIPERKIILAKKKQQLLEKLQKIHASIDYINTKQQFYDHVLDGKLEYVSNLLTREKTPRD